MRKVSLTQFNHFIALISSNKHFFLVTHDIYDGLTVILCSTHWSWKTLKDINVFLCTK